VTQAKRGERPRSIAVIGDMPHHRDADGTLYGLAPVVAQLGRWAQLFDEIVLCGPLLAGAPPAGFVAYPFPVRLEKVPRSGGNTALAKLAMLPMIPRWAWTTRRVARSVDAVHLRCPCNIAGVAIFSTWRATAYRYAMYAGVWRGYDGEPRPYGWQRRLLASRWFGGPVSVYAPADPEHLHLEASFSPSHDDVQWHASMPVAAATRARVAGRDPAGPWRLIVVGRLTPNKNHRVVLDALRLLVDRGVDASLDLLGEGPEGPRLAEQARAAGMEDRVRFHGMVDHDAVMAQFAQADVQLLATRQEGYGKVLLEGMVQGVVPVFAGSPVADEIAGGGTRGIVVDADHPELVADAVSALIDDRERWLSMIDAARAYTATVSLEAFEARIRELLERQWEVPLAHHPQRPA
jgi:glycosyltransferase involved in cell wall biosynthesis